MSAHPPTVASEQMVRRICCEFAEMPGLQLTNRQAQRLWALDEGTCGQLLNQLVEANFLRRIGPDKYARAVDGPVVFPQVRMTKAQMEPAPASTTERLARNQS